MVFAGRLALGHRGLLFGERFLDRFRAIGSQLDLICRLSLVNLGIIGFAPISRSVKFVRNRGRGNYGLGSFRFRFVVPLCRNPSVPTQSVLRIELKAARGGGEGREGEE